MMSRNKLAKQYNYKTTKQMNNTQVIYKASEYICGTCTCPKVLNCYKAITPKSDCIFCIQRLTIYEDDKYYNRLKEMFCYYPHKVPAQVIQQTYIVCGKNFELTKDTIMADYEINESDVIDKAEEYDEVEIVENVQVPEIEKIDFTIPVMDELPPPVILGKRTRETFYIPAPEDLEEEEEITYEDAEPPRKKSKTVSVWDYYLQNEDIGLVFNGACGIAYCKLKHDYYKQCKFIF